METFQGFVPVAAPSPPVRAFWGLDVRIASIASIQKFESLEAYEKNSYPYSKREYDCNYFHETNLDFSTGIYEIGLDVEIYGFKYFLVHPVFNKRMELICVGLNKQMYQFFTVIRHAPKLMEYAKNAMESAEGEYRKEEKEKRMKRTRE